MNSSFILSCDEERSILERINKQKAGLLTPAIFYTVVLMILGIVGNPVAIYIYGWKWQNTTTRIFLLWLACLDLLNCFITMPTEIFVLSSFYYFPNAGFCRLSRCFTYVINNSTSIVFLAIAWDRYIRICHPHRHAMTITTSKIACAVSVAIGIAVSWPALFLYGQKVVPIPLKKHKNVFVDGIICAIRNEMDDTPYPFAFFIYLWCGVMFCVFVLTIFYSLIGRVILQRRRLKKLKKEESKTEKRLLQHSNSDSILANNTHHSINSNHHSINSNNHNKPTVDSTQITVHDDFLELRINGNRRPTDTETPLFRTKSPSEGTIAIPCADLSNFRISARRIRPPKSTLMLFAITAVFVVSFLPFLIITIIRQSQGPTFYPSLSSVQEVLVNIFLRFYLLNNCTNPLVYGLCNSQFRRELKKLLRMSSLRRDSSMSRGESNGHRIGGRGVPR